MRFLVAEDDLDLAEALEAFLTRNQFSVDIVHDGRTAYDYASLGEYDGLILDVMMPGMDGISVLKRLRQEGISTPVMMLTAKGEKDDRILGFDSGADDYLPKPFAPDELLSRLRAMLRRKNGYVPNVIRVGDLALDTGTCTLRCSGREERLSGKEYQILELFMRSPNVILSGEKIIERVWGWDAESEIHVVWVHISNLRKKIKNLGSSVTIRASRGMGYVLEVKK